MNISGGCDGKLRKFSESDVNQLFATEKEKQKEKPALAAKGRVRKDTGEIFAF